MAQHPVGSNPPREKITRVVMQNDWQKKKRLSVKRVEPHGVCIRTVKIPGVLNYHSSDVFVKEWSLFSKLWADFSKWEVGRHWLLYKIGFLVKLPERLLTGGGVLRCFVLFFISYVQFCSLLMSTPRAREKKDSKGRTKKNLTHTHTHTKQRPSHHVHHAGQHTVSRGRRAIEGPPHPAAAVARQRQHRRLHALRAGRPPLLNDRRAGRANYHPWGLPDFPDPRQFHKPTKCGKIKTGVHRLGANKRMAHRGLAVCLWATWRGPRAVDGEHRHGGLRGGDAWGDGRAEEILANPKKNIFQAEGGRNIKKKKHTLRLGPLYS